MLEIKSNGKPGVRTRLTQPTRPTVAPWFACRTHYCFVGWIVASLRPINADDARGIANGIFLLSMASVVIWLTRRIGYGLPHRRVFVAMSLLFAGCGAARILTIEAEAWHLPAWLVYPMRMFLPAALVALSIFMFASIPMLLKVLRASDEVQSLRGQAKLKALVQAAPMAVVSTDCEGRITSWNPAAERIFGWTEKEMVGTFAATWTENRRVEQMAMHKRTLKGEVTNGFESERINRAGERFPVSISAAPLHDDSGRLVGVMATIEDISERKRIERELNEKTVTLAAITEALNSFLELGDCAAASKKLLVHALKQTQSRAAFWEWSSMDRSSGCSLMKERDGIRKRIGNFMKRR